jgi:hypothetical protein
VVSTIYLLFIFGMWSYFRIWRKRHEIAAQIVFWVTGAPVIDRSR